MVEVAVGGPGSLVGGPTTPVLVRLGANVGLFQSQGEIVGVATGEWWRLFSAMFLHAGLLHIAFNGYALYIVGGVVEQELGRWRFAVLYAVTGFCASVASYAIGSPLEPSVGASGAIFGLFGVFFAYNYQRRHLAFYAARMRSMGTLILIEMLEALLRVSDPLFALFDAPPTLHHESSWPSRGDTTARPRVDYASVRRDVGLVGSGMAIGGWPSAKSLREGLSSSSFCSRISRSSPRCSADPGGLPTEPAAEPACPRRRSRRGTLPACPHRASPATRRAWTRCSRPGPGSSGAAAGPSGR